MGRKKDSRDPLGSRPLPQEYKTDFSALFKKVEWDKHFDFEWKEIYYLIKKMPVEKKISLKFKEPDPKKIIDFLCNKHDFDKERVEKTLNKIVKTGNISQKGLGEFT